jgi:hypothetical protein
VAWLAPGGRFFETPNAWDPTQNSVAQQTFESRLGFSRRMRRRRRGRCATSSERRRVLKAVYGDSVTERGGWIDLDRIDVEIEALLEHDPAQAERMVHEPHAGV